MEYFRAISYFDKRLTIGDCYDLLKEGKVAIPLRQNGQLVGVVDRKSLLRNFVGKKLSKNNSSFNCMTQEYLELDVSVKFGVIEKLLQTNEYVLLTKKDD